MSLIDEQLKLFLQEKGIPPNPTQKNDVNSWLKTWVSFCLQTLKEDFLEPCFKQLIANKIYQRNLGNLDAYELDEFSTPSYFFTLLLLQCNKELTWFAHALNHEEIEKQILSEMDYHRPLKQVKDRIKHYYDSYYSGWLEDKISKVMQQEKLSYEKAFELFLETYTIGFIGTDTTQTLIKAHLATTVESASDTIDIIQDNSQIIQLHFSAYIKENACLSKRLTSAQPPTTNSQGDTKVEIEFHRKISSDFYTTLWRFLISTQQLKQTNLSLTINPYFHFSLDDMDKLLTLIALGKFEKIQITRQEKVLFLYSQKEGILLNDDVFDTSQTAYITLLTHLFNNEQRAAIPIQKHEEYAARNLESRLHRLAKSTIETNHSDEFSLDSKLQFAQLGETGIKVYLAVLNQTFISQLQQNKINKGFTLFLPQNDSEYGSELKPDLILGINTFLAEQLEKNSEYFFCCQKVRTHINPNDYVDLNALANLILLFDKTKLKQLELVLTGLNNRQIEQLANTLQKVSHTNIRFLGNLTVEQALTLEAINDARLQYKVAYNHHEGEAGEALALEPSKKPPHLSQVKIQALLDKKIELEPIQGKIGFQNQHHYQEQAQQKTEVTILKSWQIEQVKETRQQSKLGSSILFGEEQNSLISWQDIAAASNPNHPNHQLSCLKLGEEILSYQYKDRHLNDLWQRITGDVALTQQDVLPPENSEQSFYSPFLVKQISHKTLENIIRHPHLFQDGVHLESLPEPFCFNAREGALFSDSSRLEESNPFIPRLNFLPHADLPSAEHFNQLKNCPLPSQGFFQQVEKSATSYQAWQYWRRGFVALNTFNYQGIDALNELLAASLQASAQASDMLNYFIQALNYYHYCKRANQQSILTPNQTQFEYQQQQDYQQGVSYSLSNLLIQRLPPERRKALHLALVTIISNSAFNINQDLIPAYKNLLSSTLSYHQTRLPEYLQARLIISEEQLQQLLDILGFESGIKLLELALSNDTTVVYTVFLTLQVLHQTWGEIGLNDFNCCFLIPAINLVPLANPASQQALEQLLALSEEQYHWWQQLSLQHVQQSGFADFAQLMTAFQHFLTELTLLNLHQSLPMPCPLQGINNLQVGLNRVLCLLKKAKKPSEQLANLRDLDWSACGVVYASQDIDYQFVSADMHLNLAYELELKAFIDAQKGYYRKFDHYQARPFFWINQVADAQAQQQDFQFTLTSFYRYLGAVKYSAPTLVYQQLLDAIVLPETYLIIKEIRCIAHVNGQLTTTLDYQLNTQASLLSLLLPVIAYATSGQRPLDRLPPQQRRTKQLKQFIVAVYECARERSDDAELHQILTEKNAVAIEKLVLILTQCAELYPHRYAYQQDTEAFEREILLDFDELTLIMRLIAQSQHNYYQQCRRTPDFYAQMKEKGVEDFSCIWRQFHRSKQLLTTYKHYFLTALNRLNQYNQQSDYACFLMMFQTVETDSLSFENKGRLLKLLSLVNLRIETIFVDTLNLTDFLQALSLSQEKTGVESLDHLLNHLSCIVPKENTLVTLEELQSFLEIAITQLKNEEQLALQTLIQLHFNGFRIDSHLDEAKDSDFYPTPQALEQRFPGLGGFFSPISAVVLQHYPVAFGHSKLDSWQDFLSLLHSLKTSERQHQVLQTLIETAHTTLDLTTLNRWLIVLLNQSKYRVDFHPDYFKSLSPVLLNHPEKNAFIHILDQWLSFSSDWLSRQTNSGFIRLLNEIAAVEEGLLDVEQIYRTARALAFLASPQSSPWYESLITLIKHNQNQKITIDSLNKLFRALTKLCEITKEKQQQGSVFKDSLLQWLANSEQRFELTQKLVEQWDEDYPEQSFNIMQILAQVSGLDLAALYLFLKQMKKEALVELAACYQVQPLPAARLLQKLVAGHLTLSAFIAQHTQDPHFERDEARLKQQFDNDVLWPYFNRAKYLQPQSSQPLDFREQLHSQLKFVNYLGYEQFRTMPLSLIRQSLQNCREFLVTTPNNEEKLATYLTALSLVREALYKTSKAPAILWLSTVQMLALLAMVNHHLCANEKLNIPPLFMQIATGEGKSLVALCMAILTGLKDGAVTVVTHQASYALRDAKAFTPLLEILGIACKHLTADSYHEHFYRRQFLRENKPKSEFEGIYYIEFRDVALIRQLSVLNNGKDISGMSFIIDEGDEIILHNQTDNNLTQTTSLGEEHIHSWVFEALATYLEKLDLKQGSGSILVRDLVEFLSANYPIATRTCQQADFLCKLPLYLQEQWRARTLAIGDDFIPKRLNPESNQYYAAVLLNDKPMSPNVTFNGLTQQALHGWLNLQAKKQQAPQSFLIAPETTLLSSMSPEAVLQWMKSSGQVIALSATIGSNSELMEMQQNYGFEFIKLPKLQSNSRVDYPLQFCSNQSQQLLKIAEICTHYSGKRTAAKARAILIVVENIPFAEKVKDFLQTYTRPFSPAILHAGLEDISDQMLGELELNAGRSGQILIAVNGLISRGFDIKLTSAKQLVVIKTALRNSVDDIQIKGRTNRVNPATGLRDKGRSHAVYDLEKERKRYPDLNTSIDEINTHPQAFIERLYFAHYQQESALRLHKQLSAITKNTLQGHFFDLWQALFKDNRVLKPMRDEIFALYTQALEKMAQLVPVADFSLMTTQGRKSREQYNCSLLSFYEEALTAMQAIASDAILQVENSIPCLLEDIKNQQHQLITNHNQALATGPDKPEIPVHKTWKPGVRYNAYVEPGKQNTGSYLRERLSAWWLTAENQLAIQHSKSVLEQKIEQKKHKRSDFLTQLKQMMASKDLHITLFENLLRIYHQKIGVFEKAETSTVVQDAKQVKPKFASLRKKIGAHQTINFIHDPLIGKAYQLSLTSNISQSFETLQNLINEVYVSWEISSPLRFCITKLDNHEPDLYRIIIDFSGHDFDAVDRQQLMTILATGFSVNITPLFAAPYRPSLIGMKTVLKELLGLIPEDLKKWFKQPESALTRQNYYEAIFTPIMVVLRENYEVLNPQLQNCVDALLNYDQVWVYENYSRKLNKAYAPGFENLPSLVENNAKRKTLELINKHLKEFRVMKLSDSLLFRQQEECLIALSLGIVNSKSDDSLDSLYEKWRTSSIPCEQRSIPMDELMQRRKQKSGFFSSNISPNVAIICQQIEVLISNNQAIYAMQNQLNQAQEKTQGQQVC